MALNDVQQKELKEIFKQMQLSTERSSKIVGGVTAQSVGVITAQSMGTVGVQSMGTATIGTSTAACICLLKSCNKGCHVYDCTSNWG